GRAPPDSVQLSVPARHGAGPRPRPFHPRRLPETHAARMASRAPAHRAGAAALPGSPRPPALEAPLAALAGLEIPNARVTVRAGASRIAVDEHLVRCGCQHDLAPGDGGRHELRK